MSHPVDFSECPHGPHSPLDSIPDPQEVRERLSRSLRETALLRRLLRLAEQAAKDRKAAEKKGDDHDG